MSQENVEVVRRLFAAQGDVEAVYALFDPHIEWEDVTGLWAADWGKPRGTEELRVMVFTVRGGLVARVRAYRERGEALAAVGLSDG